MKRFLIAAAVAVATLATPLLAVADVGISVNIGQPGFYGQLDVGGFPPPQVIYSQPMMVEQGFMNRPPVYLRVPPGQIRHWRRYCRQYNACGERVYFVQDRWYNREYAPRYQEMHRGGDHRDGRQGDHQGGYGNDHHGNDHHGNDHGNGQGNDQGNGRDH
uniref:Uncharacterized protein n=1 Tax=mine drainage metagenome TaxID=410659 RepID=E6QTS8_9ZZZZ